MTREEFIEKYRFQLGGIVFDAQIARTGSTGASAAHRAFQAIERILGDAFDAVKPPTVVKPAQTQQQPATVPMQGAPQRTRTA